MKASEELVIHSLRNRDYCRNMVGIVLDYPAYQIGIFLAEIIYNL